MHTHLYTNALLTTFEHSEGYGIVDGGVLALSGDQIVYAGPKEDLPESFKTDNVTSLGGRLVTPGLVDCHTHLIYGGSRAHEFEMRQNGASYEEIARTGGGILSTVRATRDASDEELMESALGRLDRLIAEGVTTVEIKSGYGLDQETELRMLWIARDLAKKRKVRIINTFLGAHAVPPNMAADDYIDMVCIPTLKMAAEAGIVDMVDGFCENIAFTPTQIERVFEVAQNLGLKIKLHAEQLSLMGGTKLAARFGACSSDHLEYLDDKGIQAMHRANMVAVLLPGAYYFLRENKLPPIEGLRDMSVPMAIATDSNPGSSPMTSLLLAMNMGATFFGLTPLECLRGVTVNANKALGLKDGGRLSAGMRADIAIWDVSNPAELTYRMGDAPIYKRIFGGVEC